MLGKLSGISEQRAADLLPLLMARDVSLEQAPGIDAKAPVARLASDIRTPEEEVCLSAERAKIWTALQRAVSELAPRERRIVERRWLTEEPETLRQLGISFGISKERVRQLEVRAKKRMRERLEELVPLD
jgi:RNA polymerase sigma-32 factor